MRSIRICTQINVILVDWFQYHYLNANSAQKSRTIRSLTNRYLHRNRPNFFMSNLSRCSTTQINHGGPSNIDAKDRHNSCIMSNNPSALSSRSICAAGAHAMTAASSQSSSTMPQLPDTNPPSSPRRMLRAISNRIGSVVAAATSPFRNGCPPIQQVDNSPSTSIDASTITGAQNKLFAGVREKRRERRIMWSMPLTVLLWITTSWQRLQPVDFVAILTSFLCIQSR